MALSSRALRAYLSPRSHPPLRLSILIRQSFLTLINLVRRRDLDPMVRAGTGLELSHVAATGGR